SGPAAVAPATELPDPLMTFFVGLRNPAAAAEGLFHALKRLATLDEARQRLTVHRLHVTAVAGEVSADILWEIVADPRWRHETFLKSGDGSVGLLYDALAEVQARQGGKWTSHLPHFLALACEQSQAGSDRED